MLVVMEHAQGEDAGIVDATRALRLAEAELERRRDLWDLAIWRAKNDCAMNVSAIAALASVSRDTVYKAMERAEGHSLRKGG